MTVPLTVTPHVRHQSERTHDGPMENERCKMNLPKPKSFCHLAPPLPAHLYPKLFPCLVPSPLIPSLHPINQRGSRSPSLRLLPPDPRPPRRLPGDRRCRRLRLHGLAPQIFAYATNFPIQKFMQAQSIMVPSLHLRRHARRPPRPQLPRCPPVRAGLLGASLTLSISWWVIIVAQFIYIVATSRRCRLMWTGFSWQAFSGLCRFLKLSLASTVMLCFETWYLQILMLIAGLLKDPELALGSLSVW